jgi:hypothetical protein
MIVHVRPPRRPNPRDPKARLVLEWADVAFYIFSLVLIAVALVLALAYGGPSILSALR